MLIELRINGKYGGGDLIWSTTANTNGAWITEDFVIPGSSEAFCLELVTYGSPDATIIEMELAEIQLLELGFDFRKKKLFEKFLPLERPAIEMFVAILMETLVIWFYGLMKVPHI